MWIHRELEQLLSLKQGASNPLRGFPVWLLLGPRQAGKSSLMKRLGGPDRRYVNLDDLETRIRAQRDPVLFGRDLSPPCTIDEIQYAPELLSAVKMLADARPGPGAVWLTGSQNFAVIQGVRETLAGRVAILNLYGLTSAEKRIGAATPMEYLGHAFRSTFPALYTDVPEESRNLYLSSYTQTYIERDVRELLGIQKRREFELFLKLVALRIGQLVNYESLGRDAGVSSVTAKEWLGLLEDSFLIKLVAPLSANPSRRLIKSPKICFLDTGLAAHLAGWTSADTLFHGPMGGHFFESHVFSEIHRLFAHRAIPCEIDFWRTRGGEEVDFIVKSEHGVEAIEVKMSNPDPRALVDPGQLRDFGVTRCTVVSLAAPMDALERPVRLSEGWEMRPPHSFEWILKTG